MCLGIPAQIVAITDPDNLLGRVSVGGVKREINLTCVVEKGQRLEELLGEWVLVHAGFAMSRINPEEAAKTLALLKELDEFQTWRGRGERVLSEDEHDGG